MNQIIKLMDKFACQNCGNLAKPEDKNCQSCKQPFDSVKDMNFKKLFIKPKLTREEITMKKIRNNEPLCLLDFVSVRKLEELKKISIFQ